MDRRLDSRVDAGRVGEWVLVEYLGHLQHLQIRVTAAAGHMAGGWLSSPHAIDLESVDGLAELPFLSETAE